MLLRPDYIEALNRYKLVNHGNLPNVILIFRDGIGEGQIEYIKAQEIEQIQRSQPS